MKKILSLLIVSRLVFSLEIESGTSPPANMLAISPNLYVLNTYGLWKRSVDFLTSTTRKDNKLILNDIRLIPNPTTGKFAIDIHQPSKLIDLKIINANGKTEISNLRDHFNIDISSLANGIYFVLLKTEDGISVNRIVKTD